MDMWRDADGNILAVGDYGYAVYFDGTACREMDNTGASLNALCGFGPSQVYAVGLGVVMHYNGSSWISIRENPQEILHDIWGTSPNNLYAVGDAGTVLHYDGATWQEMPSGVSDNLYGIWGASADSIFVVGAGGLIRGWNGSAWSTLISGTEFDLHDLVATQDGDIWVVGDNSTILRLRRD
jgi:photosystem II stability/assembly factor-like uncharacterized protein